MTKDLRELKGGEGKGNSQSHLQEATHSFGEMTHRERGSVPRCYQNLGNGISW